MKKINHLAKSLNKLQKFQLRLGSILFFTSIVLILLQLVYLNLRYDHLVDQIPLFYTYSWGLDQIASRADLFIIPALSTIISLGGILLYYYTSVKNYKYGPQLLFFVVVFTNIFLTYSLFRSVRIGLVVSEPLISRQVLESVVPFLVTLGVTFLLAPSYVRLMERWKIVTDPVEHDHPGMILEKPSARGVGFLFILIFILASLIFVPISREILGVFVIGFSIGILGLLDDYQNTHRTSKLSFLENPLIRLGILFFLVGFLYFFEIRINFLPNVLDGSGFMNSLNFYVGEFLIQPLPWILTTVWIVWILNLLSWSNGVDGQYSGILGIALIILAFLALRFDPVTTVQQNYSQLLFIAAGVSLGLVGVTWFPSKIMWGFGAMTAGLVLASISILIQAKVITSVLILLVPFLDGLVTIFRRITEGKSPLRGDRGHLHHLLLDRGLKVPQVALIYWLVTLIFGGLSLLSADNPLLQTILMIIGIFLFLIALMNLRLLKERKLQQQSE